MGYREQVREPEYRYRSVGLVWAYETATTPIRVKPLPAQSLVHSEKKFDVPGKPFNWDLWW